MTRKKFRDNRNRAKRPDSLALTKASGSGSSYKSPSYVQGLQSDLSLPTNIPLAASGGMSSCQDNVIKERWVEPVNMHEELSLSASHPELLGKHRLANCHVPAKTDIDDVNSKDDDNFYLKKNSNFTGYELASFFTKTVFEETNKRTPKYDSIIHLMCRQLQNLGVLETTTETYNDRYYPKEPLFNLDETYRWANADKFYTPNQTPPSNCLEEKLKKLKLHNKHLRSRLNELTEELQFSKTTEEKEAVRLRSNLSLPCEIEVHTEGRSCTSVTLPSTILSISTSNENSDSHVSLSITKPGLGSLGYHATNNKPKTPVRSTSSSPGSSDSFVTAAEPSLTHSTQELSTYDNTPAELSHVTGEDNSNTLMRSFPLRNRRVSNDLSDICPNCRQSLNLNKRFSNVSLDSGLSQSYSVCPASNESSRPVDDDIKELPLHVSQSTPAFGTEYKSAYLPTSPEGSMSSCNPSDLITSPSDGNHDDIFNRADNSMNTHTLVIPPPPPPPALSMTFPRKKALRPRVNLKPLYWKRILVDNKSTLLSRPVVKPSTVWEKIKEPKIDAEELEELFAVENEKDKLTNLPSPMLTIRKKNFTKVLERKRSQNLGIILSSIRQPFSEFKKALLNFDESFLTIDTWRSLYEVRATEKEMTEIRDQVETNPKCVLDKPEQFLYNLSKLPFGLERIQCFLLRANFEEVLRDMTSLVKDMTSVCDYMVTSPHIHNLLALLLAVGNYLNGGNTHRGQADGFTLDILPKLKDIKGKKQTTLLKYIASKYQSLHGSEKRRVELPLPSHSTLEAVSCTNYTELSEQMTSLQSQLSDCGDLMSKVKSTLSDQSCNELFYNVMSGFVMEANGEVTALSQSVTDSKVKFAEMCKFYSAPNVDWSKTIPSQFFEPWKTFSKDLTQVWDCKGPPALHSRVSAFF